MENKETKNNKTEELNDEALDEVTGGAFELRDYGVDSSVLTRKNPQSKQIETPGTITTPTLPTDTYRKF